MWYDDNDESVKVPVAPGDMKYSTRQPYFSQRYAIHKLSVSESLSILESARLPKLTDFRNKLNSNHPWWLYGNGKNFPGKIAHEGRYSSSAAKPENSRMCITKASEKQVKIDFQTGCWLLADDDDAVDEAEDDGSLHWYTGKVARPVCRYENCLGWHDEHKDDLLWRIT